MPVGIESQNVDFSAVRYWSDLFRFRLCEDCAEVYRVNRHLLRPQASDRKWFSIPLAIPLTAGKTYCLEYTLRSTCDLPRSFFLAVGKKTQELPSAIKKEEWVQGKIEFVSRLSGDASLTLTATDLSIASHYVWIKRLNFSEKSEKPENSLKATGGGSKNLENRNLSTKGFLNGQLETRDYYGEPYSLLGYGCMRFHREGNTVVRGEAEPLIDLAVANGVNYFDCAHIYPGSEAFLGAALSKYPRKSYYIATKLHARSFKEIGEVKRVFEGQLKRLKTDYIDNYLLHGVKGHIWKKLEQTYDVLASLKKAGAIRHLGFSFHDTPELLKEVVSSHEWDFAQIQLNYLDWKLQDAEGQYQILREAGLPIFVMEGLRGGVLAENAELAFRWIAQFPEVTTILSGMVSEEQVKQNIEIFSRIAPLSEADSAQIQKLREELLASGRIPCTACRYCEVCPKNIDIPTAIAAYNQYRSGKNLDNGRNATTDFIYRLNYISAARSPKRCVKCGKCKEVCPQHIDIPAVLREIIDERNRLLEK